MITMKEVLTKAQNNETDYNAYDEYFDEMQKKYDCERVMAMKQREFKRDSTWDNVGRRARA